MKRKLLLISYGDIKYDGRLRSFFEILAQMGDLYSASRGCSESTRHREMPKHFLKYIRETVSYATELKGIDILFVDNRKACLPGLIICAILKPRIIIQDCRELYISREIRRTFGKIGCVIERLMMRKADIILSANQYRSDIMRKIYKLPKNPIIYENIRRLQYESDEAEKNAGDYLNQYICDGEYRIIATSGCDIFRMTDILVHNMKKVNYRYRLFLVGQDRGKDVDKIKLIMKEQSISNVTIIGRLDQNQLKYLISHSHIGIVNYNQSDTNNKYCASGKLYEFIYEGIPVVTTTNPPLKNICDRYNIGISDDGFAGGINGILENYPTFSENVNQFIRNHSVEAAQDVFLDMLVKEMESVLC